jgi:hypothetical protein
MCKLSHRQSVVFAAPPEIDTQIRNPSPPITTPLKPSDNVGALDVLCWAMLITCRDLQHHVSHWAQQGIEYHRRVEAWRQYVTSEDTSVLQKEWQAQESRSLEELYGIKPASESPPSSANFTQQAFELHNLRDRLEILGIEHLENPSMDEEQEREIHQEIEQERQIERPPKRRPATHTVHQNVRKFILTGTVPRQSACFKSLFHPFQSLDSQGVTPWSRKLLASTDFAQTLSNSSTDGLSEYMRPENWILQGLDEVYVVLSPFEINQFLPLIRRSNKVQLHIYAPRVTQSMRSFSNLKFYSIPSHSNLQQAVIPFSACMQLQLDLFAGQLYLSNYQEYNLLCTMLGLYYPPLDLLDEQSEIKVGSDGFVDPEHRARLVKFNPEYAECRFESSPIPMLKELVGLRRKGMKYVLTHVGKILHGRVLTQNDF